MTNSFEQNAHIDRLEAERHKAFYDYLKHLNTLSTGSILLLATFLEKLFTRPAWKILVVVSFSSFILAILGSFVVYTIFLGSFPGPTTDQLRGSRDIKVSRGTLWLVWIGFFIGVLSLAVFAIKNLFAH